MQAFVVRRPSIFSNDYCSEAGKTDSLHFQNQKKKIYIYIYSWRNEFCSNRMTTLFLCHLITSKEALHVSYVVFFFKSIYLTERYGNIKRTIISESSTQKPFLGEAKASYKCLWHNPLHTLLSLWKFIVSTYL